MSERNAVLITSGERRWFRGGRAAVREFAATFALDLLRRAL